MIRPVLVGLLASLVTPATAMAKGPEACILKATETITSPRKPNIFTMSMDCGTDTTHEQQSALSFVSSADNTTDAVSHMLGLGYSVAAATTMVSYTGNAVISTYTFAKMPTAAAAGGFRPTMVPVVSDPLDELPEADDEEMLELSEDESLDSDEMLDDEMLDE